MITADACWAEFRMSSDTTRGRPCLFLDRDGVLIEDTGYPHRADDVVPIHETLALVRDANRRGYVVGVVTNQSGIGRGLFGWPEFRSVQAVIDAALAALGARIDFVLACPHHAEASDALYRRDTHAWRKPEPGMLNAAAGDLALDLTRSVMLGDRASDMQAAARAGVPYRLLLGGAATDGPAGQWRPLSRAQLAGAFENLTTP